MKAPDHYETLVRTLSTGQGKSDCKKIRDDKGYWQQIDAYIAGHYPAIEFAHSICPDCTKRLYPQHYDDKVGVTPKNIKKLEAENGTRDKTPQSVTTSILKMPIIISDGIPAPVGLHPIAKIRPIAYTSFNEKKEIRNAKQEREFARPGSMGWELSNRGNLRNATRGNRRKLK